MARSVLVIFAHPAFERSRVHRRLLEIPRRLGAEVRDLYELYPDFDIDVAAEQDAMLGHDVVVFQHPIYWYSVPPMLRQWQDLVLEHGWAYGAHGRALQNKVGVHAVSTGGPERAYRADGANRFTLEELMRPLEQTLRLCRMHWSEPMVVHGSHRIKDDALDAAAERYGDLLTGLSRGNG